MKQETTTVRLENALESAKPEDLAAFLAGQQAHMVSGDNPLAGYLRGLFREKGIEQRRLFIDADILDSYGYKLVRGERHPRSKDPYLRLFYAAGFTLAEAQRGLKLAGLPELYARVPREAVLMAAFHQGLHSVEDVNALLARHGMEPLKTIGTLDD